MIAGNQDPHLYELKEKKLSFNKKLLSSLKLFLSWSLQLVTAIK